MKVVHYFVGPAVQKCHVRLICKLSQVSKFPILKPPSSMLQEKPLETADRTTFLAYKHVVHIAHEYLDLCTIKIVEKN
jgi:hypothetical protein